MKQSQNRGFTLPEILITLGIVAIVLSMAVPAVGTTIKNNRLATTLNQVESAAELIFMRRPSGSWSGQ